MAWVAARRRSSSEGILLGFTSRVGVTALAGLTVMDGAAGFTGVRAAWPACAASAAAFFSAIVFLAGFKSVIARNNCSVITLVRNAPASGSSFGKTSV